MRISFTKFILHILSLAVLYHSAIGISDDALLYMQAEELIKIRNIYKTSMNAFVAKQLKEINNIPTEYSFEKSNLIKEVEEAEKWWTKDAVRRDIEILDKLIELRYNQTKPFKDTNFQSYKNELMNGLESANKFWEHEIKQIVEKTRKQEQHNYFVEEDIVSTTPELNLPSVQQSVYNNQVLLITRIRNVLDLLIAVKLIRFQINQNISKDAVSYISEKTKVDRIRETILRVQSKHYLNNLKTATIEKIKTIWRNTDNDEKRIITLFKDIYEQFTKNAFGVLKKIDETVKMKWPGSNLYGLYF